MTVFVDANILIYAADPSTKGEQARRILSEPFVTGVQALNELTNVLLRKFGRPLEQAAIASLGVRNSADRIEPILLVDHERALELKERYKFGWWDALLLATALRSGADVFLSEDLQHGQVIEGGLQVVNPFLDA